MVSRLIVHPIQLSSEGAPLRAALSLPDDEEMALCRVALASACLGTTRLQLGALPEQVRVLLGALSAFGLKWDWDPSAQRLCVHGRGLDGLERAEQALDLRGAPAAAALLIGLCVSRPFASEFWADPIVAQLLVELFESRHRVSATALESSETGYRVVLAALDPESPRPQGIERVDHGAFAWVKQAALLAGLRASSPTVFEERWASNDHLERALLHLRAPLDGQGTSICLHPPRDAHALTAADYERVGSPTLGVAVIAAALCLPSGELGLRDVALNPSRTQVVAVLRAAGLSVNVVPEGDRQGEPVGRIVVGWGTGDPGRPAGIFRGQSVTGETALRLGDAVLYLTALAGTGNEWTFTEGLLAGSERDARIWGRASGLLRSSGRSVEKMPDGLSVSGTSSPKPLVVTSGGDARLVLLATILALRAPAPSAIDDVDCLRDTFPKWVGTLRALGAKVQVEHATS